MTELGSIHPATQLYDRRSPLNTLRTSHHKSHFAIGVDNAQLSLINGELLCRAPVLINGHREGTSRR